MSNKEIARTFQLLGNIMELHAENPFKVRSYHNAYMYLRKWETPLSEMSREEIDAIKGVGKAIGDKIQELLSTGRLSTLEKYRDITPPGVQEILNVPGIGPKKTAVIWKELGIESVGELLYAVNENRLVELKGFGAKTQADLKEKLEYYLRAQGHFHFAALEAEALALCDEVRAILPGARVVLVGEMGRRCNTVESIDLLIGFDGSLEQLFQSGLLQASDVSSQPITASTIRDTPVRIFTCKPEEFGSKQFRHTAAPAFLEAFISAFPGVDFRDIPEEAEVFRRVGIPYIVPELRDRPEVIEAARSGPLPELVAEKDIRSVIHAHTTYSDGLHSLGEMAEYARSKGFEWIGITDHSRSAVYAHGLETERVLMQWREIDELNAGYISSGADFRILKGIESDILNDGSLDYEPDILAGFNFVIASIHSNLRMDEDKATKRLITAIENPYTTILGHPTGRLLLSRPGYPIAHKKVIDACAANGVAIEINANPYRLDIDWTWIPYAMERGVYIAVNPDAHSREGIRDIRYGVFSARKGGLTAGACLNRLSVEAFLDFSRPD